ncbi:MAG: type II secretion system GspH family protein [Planctomycetes bacterium]|jgi:prepilin-type N-terminal cleavage/methylation domain-containing protein/prepilin-type processing-associated H-X9-DG protein|nr:type II secretion system GspH family protein [Planctomycetota bacterium]
MTKRRGFTLIELLVVIAIIALLMSILMPALSRVKKQAQSVACMSRLKSWALMYKLYTDDYQGSFPLGWGRNDTDQWCVSMRSYYRDEFDMLLCPTATRLVIGAGDSATWKAWTRTIGGYAYIGSYGNNSWTDNMSADRGDRKKEWFWKTTQNVPNASIVPVLGDSTWHDAWPRHTDTPISSLLGFAYGDQGTTNEMNHFCINRHNGWTNLMFADWSVRHVGIKELWTLKWHRDFNVAGPWTKQGGVTGGDWPQWMRKYKDY